MPKENIPLNPQISRGIEVIYVGAGYLSITGESSGLIYYVSDHNRHFTVASEDADDIVKNKSIIYKP